MKSVYNYTDNPEVYVFLAFSLYNYGNLVGYTEENNRLEFYLYQKVVNEYFGKVIHSDISAAYLGIMYTFGRGCEVDYNKAVYYLQMATNAGFDCTDFLAHFKKKMFGGYTFIG